MGHSRPMHLVPVPINVRCYSNSNPIVRRSEVTLRANKRLMHCTKKACIFASSLTGRILHVAHEFEAKAKKQSRTGFGGCRVVIDDCDEGSLATTAPALDTSRVWPGKPHPKTMPIRPRHRVRLGRTARAGRVTGCPRTLTRRRGLQSSSRPIGLRDPSKTRSPYHKGGDTNGCSR
jgi:hypothetical protein